MAPIITELQANLEAIYSQSSGSTAPASPVKGMPWLDTTTAAKPLVKMYDGAAWVVIGSIDPTLHTFKPDAQASALLKAYNSPDLAGLSLLTVTLPAEYSMFRVKIVGIALTADGVIRLRCGPAGGSIHSGASDYAFQVYGRSSVDGAVSANGVASSADIAGAGGNDDLSVDLTLTDGGMGGRWRGAATVVGKTGSGGDYAHSRGFLCNPTGVKKQLQFIFTQPVVSGNIRIYGEN
ncbi:hypothetical protein [Aureimonas endophytica]|nr:hypothetical protein [Aureimonas endophytica]